MTTTEPDTTAAYLAALVSPMTARQVAAGFNLSGTAIGGVAAKLSAMVRRGLLRFNQADADVREGRSMTWFEQEKRARNLAQGYKETKGLKDGHCNRAACQAPLAGKKQHSMRDHELMTDARLYYCDPCAGQFNAWDRKSGDPQRCREEPAT